MKRKGSPTLEIRILVSGDPFLFNGKFRWNLLLNQKALRVNDVHLYEDADYCEQQYLVCDYIGADRTRIIVNYNSKSVDI